MNVLEKLEYWRNRLEILNNDNIRLTFKIRDLKLLKEDLSYLLLLPSKDTLGSIGTMVKSYLSLLKYIVKKEEVIKIIKLDIRDTNKEIKDLINKRKNILKDMEELRKKIIIIESSNHEEIPRLEEERKSKIENEKRKEIKEYEEFYNKYGRNISQYDLHRGEK